MRAEGLRQRGGVGKNLDWGNDDTAGWFEFRVSRFWIFPETGGVFDVGVGLFAKRPRAALT
jgi:hypothetical protein